MTLIANNQRGCGYLRENAIYLRSDLTPNGELPPIVCFETPISFLEKHFRGYKMFNGLVFQLIRSPQQKTDPEHDLETFIDRLKIFSPTNYRGDNLDLARDKSCWGHDLIMWVGESYYPTAIDFIQEVKEFGLNKRIPLAPPPSIFPGFTRLFLLHKKAINNSKPGLFGYVYLTRTIYTTPQNREIPLWVERLSEIKQLEFVSFGAEIPNQNATEVEENSPPLPLGT